MRCRLFSLFLVSLALACLPESSDDPASEPIEEGTQALGAEDCLSASAGGKVGICHATGNPQKPYVHARLNTKACIQAHSEHAADFVSDDPSCPVDSPPTFSGVGKVVAYAETYATLTWTAASDDKTPAAGIVYDICVSTSSGSCRTNFVIAHTAGERMGMASSAMARLPTAPLRCGCLASAARSS